MNNTTLDTTLNNQTDLNSLLQGSSGSLIPDSYVQSFMTMMAIGTIISCVILGLFLVMYIIGAIRKWKVQSAVLHMQKDISEIKQHLIAGAASNPQPTDAPDRQETAEPPRDNSLIAAER